MLKYFFWHYGKGIKSYFRIWRNFLEFWWNFFSIKLLLRTLFSHWRRDITNVFVFNLASRAVGAVVRIITIFLGLMVEILTLYLGVILFFVWLFLPLLGLIFIVDGLSFIFSAKYLEGAGVILISIIIFCLDWRCYYFDTRKMPSEMSLEEMKKQRWFNRIWLRRSKDQEFSEEDFKEIADWTGRQYEKEEKAKMFWRRENLLAARGIGKDWAYGYTVNLDKFSVDLGAPQPRKFKPYLIGRQKDIEEIERVLSRMEENNILIVGEPGTGRKTVVKGFADFVYEGKVLPPLKHKRVLELDLGAVTAGASNNSEIEARLRKVLDEAISAGNIILVIDNFHEFVNLTNVFLPYLGSKNIQLIGIVTYEGLHKNIEANPSLLKYFEKVEIREPDEKNSLLILEDIVPRLEQRMGIPVTYKALKEIVTKAAQYFSDVPMPERAIDLLDEIIIYVATKTEDSAVEVKHVDIILSQKTKIPIGEISKDEKERLVKLEDILHQRIINQAEAIKSLASAMRRSRLGISEKKKPIGSFLFLGPTGVGKTETAKALAEAYFGNEERITRFDMSEYQNTNDLERLIGDKEKPGFLAVAIKENPFSLLLLDEIEKTHSNILNLFLQVLDEGWLTDSWGRKISFRNNIIIATSNAGAELIRQMVKEGINPVVEREKIMDYLQREGIFKPEFLNRFDDIVIFHPLSKENLVAIANLLLKKLSQRMLEQKINFVINPGLVERVAELGFSPEYGARPMKRVIQDRVENLISQKILSGTLKSGERIEIKPEEI